MRLLPEWVLTDRHPAFYDTESGSAIVQTAKVYAAMNELIKEYNSFAKTVNEIISEFKAESEKEQECFKICITELIENYIKSIDLMIDKQNLKIDNTIGFIKENLDESIKALAEEMLANGEITITQVYNPETESLDLVVGEGA